ncbi:type II secretion system protein [Nocardioides glacieisoli]|uniref:Type II secretion system protein n=1 Tax=Nocardioides glacieisoli TaxID=1168730 RepID=A0A4Q2RHW5_9ACTN|nr:type II secretion system F family protein [Nocardioides glacieisoli]RYB88300.1 type II secretion system protein [Nocardioides glacieisoli]
MTFGLLLGAALGASLCLLVFALVPPRPALASVVGRWERQRARQAAVVELDVDDTSWQGRLGRWLVAQLAQRGITLGKLRADLELIDYTLEGHLVRKMTYGLLGLLLPTILTVTMMAIGVTPPLTVPAVGGLALGALFFWVPDLSVVQAAEQRRHELRRALSCYLDLVAMSLAGGRGIPEALPTAARIGTGWAFELLRSTIDRARLVGDTPWAALADLGKRTGMQELQDLGGALMLVADDGAKVRQSLTARASTQRRRQLAEAEGAAAKADQSVEMAQVVLFIGFVLFLGFPAVVAVMGI